MTLKEIRKSKGLSQIEACEICLIPIRTYKRLENDASYQHSLKYKQCVETLSSLNKRNKIKTKKQNIVVVGAGYVGLSTAVLLGEQHDVVLVDINETRVDLVNNRIAPFKDKDIEKALKDNSLSLVAKLPDDSVYKNADYVFLALPTDYNEQTGKYDLVSLNNTIKGIRRINKEVPVVIKSTVSIGYTRSLHDENIIFCPEFLREGRALFDCKNPSRIILGIDKLNSKTKHISRILSNSVSNNPPIIIMKSDEAEAVKLFANTYLSMRVAFFNELDSFLLKNNMNTKNVINGVCLDSRIGDYYNNPSFGYGGYCLPKDTKVLANVLSQEENSELITSIAKSNLSRKSSLAKEIICYCQNMTNKELKDIVIGIYSLSSKSESDNTRFSALSDVVEILKNKGLKILYFDHSIKINNFKDECDVVLANRLEDVPEELWEKTYTRDIFFNN